MNKQIDPTQRIYSTVPAPEKGKGPGSAGQSGDTQGLSEVAESNAESITELVEEGQYFEAAVISGVEEASEAEVEAVHTKQVQEDVVTSKVPAKASA